MRVSTFDPSQKAQITAIACLFLASSFSRLSSLRAWKRVRRSDREREAGKVTATEEDRQTPVTATRKHERACHHPHRTSVRERERQCVLRSLAGRSCPPASRASTPRWWWQPPRSASGASAPAGFFGPEGLNQPEEHISQQRTPQGPEKYPERQSQYPSQGGNQQLKEKGTVTRRWLGG